MQFRNVDFCRLCENAKCQKIGIGVDKTRNYKGENDHTLRSVWQELPKNTLFRSRATPPFFTFFSKSAQPQNPQNPNPFRTHPDFYETVTRHIVNQSSRSSPDSIRINKDVQHRFTKYINYYYFIIY